MKVPSMDAVKVCDAHIMTTLSVRRVNELRFRYWLAKHLIRLATRIAPEATMIVEEEKEEESK